MKKLFFVLTVCIWNIAASLPARAADCRQYKVMPEIKFSTSYGKLVYDVTNDRQRLTALGEKLGIVEHIFTRSRLQIIGDVDYRILIADKHFHFRRNDTYCAIRLPAAGRINRYLIIDTDCRQA